MDQIARRELLKLGLASFALPFAAFKVFGSPAGRSRWELEVDSPEGFRGRYLFSIDRSPKGFPLATLNGGQPSEAMRFIDGFFRFAWKGPDYQAELFCRFDSWDSNSLVIRSYSVFEQTDRQWQAPNGERVKLFRSAMFEGKQKLRDSRP